MTDVPSRQELLGYLVRHRIAGDIATPRENSLEKYRRLAERDPDVTFGMTFGKPWSAADVLALMGERVGVSVDPGYSAGPDHIEPEATVGALERLAARLAAAAASKERVLLATGHPAGLLPIYQAIATSLRRVGCVVLQPASGRHVTVADYRSAGQIRFVGGVAMFAIHASLRHTHAPEPMRMMLSAGAERPDLVIADHGWAGAAGEVGVHAAGFADSNDPAFFAGEAEDKITVAVPVDDNVLPQLYAPLTAYVLDHATLPPADPYLW